MELWKKLESVKNDIESRIETFKPIDLENIPDEEKLKLETGKWYRIKDVVCVYLDLKDSTKASFEETKEEMAKIYEYIGTSMTKIFSLAGIEADFIDLKGDGGFALFHSKYPEARAVVGAVTFKTYSYKYMKKKFPDIEIKFGIGISKGNLLVKKIGIRTWNFPVWAGKVVNYAAYLCKEVKGKFNFERDVIGMDQYIYTAIDNDKFRNWLVWSCGCPTGKKTLLWKQGIPSDNAYPTFHYLEANWCDTHGEEYINKVLEIITGKDEI